MNKIEKVKDNFRIITSKSNGKWYLDIIPKSYWSSGGVFTDPARLIFQQSFINEEQAKNYGLNYIIIS